jgi:hypothetical protein
MTQIIILEKKFITPLGLVRCGLKCNAIINKTLGTKIYENGKSEIFCTTSHKIELIEFKIKLPLFNEETVTDTSGWIYRIEKFSDTQEIIETFCLLDNKDSNIEFDYSGGENLDSIEAANNEWILDIGTEDGESYNSRAEMNDWFPPRLRNFDFDYKSIAQMQENGFTASIDLRKGEKIHLQYLSAFGKKIKNKISTNLAVDASKKVLEKWIGI